MQITGPYDISWLEKTDSTSSYARVRINDLKSYSVIAALEQTSGRGQGDHKWHSARGENLTFSIFVRYDANMPLKALDQQLLTMASSLSVIDFLKDFNIDAGIKKPNDIYVEGKKICGMLIENGLTGNMMCWSIIGMGIDVNEESFPDYLPNPTSIYLQTGERHEIKKCLEEYLVHFHKRFHSIWSDPDGLEVNYESLVLELK